MSGRRMRKVHIDGQEWRWCYLSHWHGEDEVVIARDPVTNEWHRIPVYDVGERCASEHDCWPYAVSPGRVKGYIVRNIVNA